MVTIEEVGDGERSIVTPELRLRFRKIGDRWTHAIDIGPPGWQTLAEAVEWTSAAGDPARVVSPTYQELHFQGGGADVTALLVGQAGPHHFSASVRVSHDVRPQSPSHDFGHEYARTLVDFDVADRCRAEVRSVECSYVVHSPPVTIHLGDSGDLDQPDGFRRDERPYVCWEANTDNNYGVMIQGSDDSSVSMLEHGPHGRYRVCAVPRSVKPSGTQRIRYSWSHTRVLKRRA